MSRAPVVFIHPSDELYGADRMLLQFLEALPDGVAAEVWLPTDLVHPAGSLCAELSRRGVVNRHVDLPILRRAHRRPVALVRLAGRGWRLRKDIRSVAPSMVYCTTSAAFLAAPIARSLGVHAVIGHEQEIWGRTDRVVLGLLARSCHRLLAISDSVRGSTPSRLARRTTVVPNATPEPESVTPIPSGCAPLTFLVASRWNSWKGHRTLLAAWDRLGQPGRLIILGGAPPSGESVDVIESVAALDDPSSVEVVGEVTDPAPYIERADVVVVPSDRPEPFGLVAIEAFARGRPVVASAAGGLLDIVTSGENGWLFPSGDVDALAELIEGLDRPAVVAAGRRARQTYLHSYTAATFAQRWRQAVDLTAP